MTFWERNYIIITGAGLVAAAFYFYSVISSSLAAQAVVAPSLRLFIIYVVLYVGLALVGMFISDLRDGEDKPPGGEDERDRFVRMKAEAGAGHVYTGAMMLVLLTWFLHKDSNLMFHLLIVGLTAGDLTRSGLQVFNYNRAY